MVTVPERFQLRTEPVNEKRFVGLFLAAGFVQIVLDAISTMLAYYYGGGYEANPVMRHHLQAGPSQYILVNSVGLGVTLACGVGLVYYLRKADPPWNYRLALGGQLLFVLAIGWGLAISLSNLLIFL